MKNMQNDSIDIRTFAQQSIAFSMRTCDREKTTDETEMSEIKIYTWEEYGKRIYYISI